MAAVLPSWQPSVAAYNSPSSALKEDPVSIIREAEDSNSPESEREGEDVRSASETTPATHFLLASPYVEQQHQLDLRTIDTANRLLALALTELETATDAYAVVKYEDAFEWTTLMARLKELADAEGFRWTRRDFYVVEFRSKLKADIDRPLLYALDKESHAEATQSGGLLKYWYGTPDVERRNLATCLWRAKEDAIAGGKGPWHKKARACIQNMYEDINVKGLRLTIDDDAHSWTFQPYR